jgi:hypothetical protein
MPSIETYRKQAKLLLRWHRERNYSIGGKARLLERYRHLTDVEVLNMPLPLTLAQEIVAVEAGFRDWAALKAGMGDTMQPSRVGKRSSRNTPLRSLQCLPPPSRSARFLD